MRLQLALSYLSIMEENMRLQFGIIISVCNGREYEITV